MGSGESSTRKVSFGVDDEERIRILRGVKLSEDVLQRMKGVANLVPEQPVSPQKDPAPPPSPKPRPQPCEKPCPQPCEKPCPQPCEKPCPQPCEKPRPQPCEKPRPQPSEQPTPTASDAKEEELKKRYERQQAIVQEEMVKVARREREAARVEMSKALQRERAHAHQENDKAKTLGKQLMKKDAELKALDAFYKEQILQLEQRNLERYAQTNKQFHEYATRSEANVRPRNTEGVCGGLQAQIVSCYRENRGQTLDCSDLAKDYMQCIHAAKKNLLNHG